MRGEELKQNQNSFERLRRLLLLLLTALTEKHDEDDQRSDQGLNQSILQSSSFSVRRVVVLLFDDAQWCDPQSLRLIQDLAEENIPGLFLVSTYRTEDVADDPSHPVAQQLHFLRQHCSSRVHESILQGLTLAELCSLLGNALGVAQDATRLEMLAQVVHEKTLGNPLFVESFVQALQKEGHLKFSLQSLSWEWADAQQIRRAMSILSTEVADVIARSMKSLDPNRLKVLKVSSCTGQQVLPPIIQGYLDLDLQRTDPEPSTGGNESDETTDLAEILEELVMAKSFRQKEGSSVYYWAHAKLQQAAFSLMSETERHQLHLRLGKLLLQELSSPMRTLTVSLPREVLVYLAVGQFNQIPVVTLHAEAGPALLLDLAKLNLEAAKLSIAKSAFHPAVKLLRAGIDLMQAETPDSGSKMWSIDYELTLQLHNHLAEVCYTTGDHDAAKRAIQEILQKATCKEDKYRCQSCLLEITTNGARRDIMGGAFMCVEFLKAYGVNFPKKIGKRALFLERQKLKREFSPDPLEKLLVAPIIPSDDDTSMCVALFLGKLADLAFVAGAFALSELAALKAFRHAKKRGISIYCCQALVMYAIRKRQKQKCEKAYLRAQMAEDMLKVVRLYGNDFLVARVLVPIHGGLMPLKRPLQDSLDPFLEAHRCGIKSGDTEYALLGAMLYSYSYFMVGLPLGHLESDLAEYGAESRQLGLAPAICVQFPIMQQCAMSLMGKSPNPTKLEGIAMGKANALSSVMEGKAQSQTTRDICIFQLFLSCVYRDYETAEMMLAELNAFPRFNPAIVRMHIWNIYAGLAAFGIASASKGAKKRKKFQTLGKEALDYFRQHAQQGSLNAYPLLELLLAEQSPNKTAYDKAISVCARSGLKNFEAMANESCGLFFLKPGQQDEEWASYYLTRAAKLYNEWGAIGKCQRLKTDHNCINDEEALPSNRGSGHKGKRVYRKSLLENTERSMSFQESELGLG